MNSIKIITLENYCLKYDIYNTLLKNTLFWNQFIGEDCFDLEYLHSELNNPYNNILIAYDINLKVYDNLEGILIYRKLNNIKNNFCKINYSSITLLAKKINSNHKWLGKDMIDFFRIRLNEKTKVILADDTDIPNYYSKLGFKKENKNKYKKILDEYDRNIYSKIFN